MDDGITFESVLRDLRERDARDAARAIAPMKPAPDAILVDSSGMSIEEVVARLAEDVSQPRGGRPPSAVDRPEIPK